MIVHQIWCKVQETDNHHGGMCQICVSEKSKMVATAILNFKNVISSIGRRYFQQIWHKDASRLYGDHRKYSDNITNNCKMAFVFDRLSDEYNF